MANWYYYLRHVCPFVCLSVSQLPLKVFSRKFSFFFKSVEKILISLKLTITNGYFTWRPIYIYHHISLTSSSNETFFGQNCRENQNTHSMFNNFFRKSCRLWDNAEKSGVVGQATDDNVIRCMSFACLMTKATDIHSECVIFFAFPLQ